MKAWLLRLHRWAAILFALPMSVIIVTGLVLSFEPIANDRSFIARPVSLEQIDAVLSKFDPVGTASSLNMRAYDNVIVVAQGRGTPVKRIDLAALTVVPTEISLWSDIFSTTRRLHQTLLLDLEWLVVFSTFALLAVMAIGIFMGWPHFRNSLGGWHRTVAWIMSPFLFLSALSGPAIAFGITFAPPVARVSGEPVPLREAVRIISAQHDLASVVWIRLQGGATRVRLYDDRQARVFTVTRAGLVAVPQSWPRLLHEGVWAGTISGILNVMISVVFAGLMVTGLVIWARRNVLKSITRRLGAPSRTSIGESA